MKTIPTLILVVVGLSALSQEDACSLLPDPGPCLAAIPAWYFDQDTQSCTQFIWGGCDGVVPFETLESCLAAECSESPGTLSVCDSIEVTAQTVGDATLGHMEILVHPDYQSPIWIGYAGFALYDSEGSLLAAESVETAPNAFGFDGNVEPHLRFLEYEPGVDLSVSPAPFPWELRLYEGWMAGNSELVCQWTWTETDVPSGVPQIDMTPGNDGNRFFDLMGRPVEPEAGRILLIRSRSGLVRKVCLTE